ncbi:MAG: peptidoglycan DD-metalloendopeptidase family protein [Lachnospiraceae bacterium]|nr:peptidoglycan DD-metalloendopeptidase family protein [Lachnospiraceae bacterium]MBQ8948059.1 peptidoglycan DD-metalloendopeptidase family protein [Lachnospiraceae bacterium]
MSFRYGSFARISKLRAISYILVLTLALPVFFGLPLPAYATPTNASIQAKQSEVAKDKEQVNSLKNGLSDVKKIKQQLESQKSDLNAYIAQLDAQLTDMAEKIAELNELITTKEAEIVQATDDLAEAERIQKEQYEAMKKRIKFMYESGDSMYMDMLVGDGSFSDKISKADYIEMLSAYDRRKLDEYVETTEYVAACKAALESEKEVLDAAKETVEEEQKNVNELMDAKTEQVNSVSAEIADKEAQIKEYENSIAEQNAAIAALEKAIAAEIAALEEANRRQYNGGVFAWPCPSYTRISDDYGNRVHPILGVEKFHNGIDLAAPYGSSILAAYDGDVVAADYSSSMGNYVMISHGSGIYTIYMHASSLKVSKGQSVSKGQVIAAVGSTGRSTGNHLHFSVRKDGNYVSPWGYLK